MNCRRCQRLLSEHLDGELAPRAARAVEVHLEACRLCAAVRDELGLLAGWMDGLRIDGPAAPRVSALCPEPGDALWRSIEAELDADDEEVERRRRRFSLRLAVPAMAGAALCATVAATQGARLVSARRADHAIDDELREGAARVLSSTDARYRSAERELSALAGAAAAPPASNPTLLVGLDGDALAAALDRRFAAVQALAEAATVDRGDAVLATEVEVVPPAAAPVAGGRRGRP